MERNTFDIDTWRDWGETLLDIGKSVPKSDKAHHKAIDYIRRDLPKLQEAFESKDLVKAKKINIELNNVRGDVEKNTWRLWTTRIRAKKNSEDKHSLRVGKYQFEYLQDFAAHNTVEVKDVMIGICSKYFLVSEFEKRYLESFSKLNASEKNICRVIFEELMDASIEGREPEVAKKVCEERGEEVYPDFRYIFRDIEKSPFEPEDIRVVKFMRKVYEGVTIAVTPLSFGILRHIVFLRRQYSSFIKT